MNIRQVKNKNWSCNSEYNTLRQAVIYKIKLNIQLPVTWWQDLLHGLEIHLEIHTQVWRLSEKFDIRGYKYK